ELHPAEAHDELGQIARRDAQLAGNPDLASGAHAPPYTTGDKNAPSPHYLASASRRITPPTRRYRAYTSPPNARTAGPPRSTRVRTRTRSDTHAGMTAAIPAAREKRANNNPSSKEAHVNRNEPRGVAAEMRPSTPPWPENASAVRRPTRFRSNEKTRVSLDWASQRTKRRLAATATPASPKTTR